MKIIKISNNSLLIIGVITFLCLIVVYQYLTNPQLQEPFATEVNDLENKLLSNYMDDLNDKSPEELRKMTAGMQLLMDKYGLGAATGPDMSKYALKSQITPDTGKCVVARAEDRDKYIPKTDIDPSGTTKVDLSKYVLKSSIPPEKICPPQKEVDMSKYVLKSSLPPEQKCPDLIVPKIKVDANLCKKCDPKVDCPRPEPCPKCECKPCPPCKAPVCPHPEPCPKCDEKVRYDIKYIKVPTVITRTIIQDERGNVVDSRVETDKSTASTLSTSGNPAIRPMSMTSAPSPTSSGSGSTTINAGASQQSATTSTYQTIDPEVEEENNYARIMMNNKCSGTNCVSADLNSDFKNYGIYGSPY